VAVNDLFVFLLLFAAIGIGWFLGRRQAQAKLQTADFPSQYYRGLNYLLDGRSDGAVDAFIEALEVNSETLDTHIALGNLLRKRGEVERAIRVHQNLLARPSLPRHRLHEAHLELARDYISAGLLDRAERLLLDLCGEAGSLRATAQRHLLDIYRSEREWQQAIAVATDMLPRKTLLGNSTEGAGPGQAVSIALSHFRCELAREKLESGEIQAARNLLRETLQQEPGCVRASLMLGEVEHVSGNYRQAIKALRAIRRQDPGYLTEAVGLLRQCHAQLGEEVELARWLLECVQDAPSSLLVLAVAEDVQQAEGIQAASAFLAAQLADNPSLWGVGRLIGLQRGASQGSAREDLDVLQILVDRLSAQSPAYRCDHCGYSSRKLHWFCPGCKYWGTIKNIRGAALD
jgi:lipopolysaccharide assembly protein B